MLSKLPRLEWQLLVLAFLLAITPFKIISLLIVIWLIASSLKQNIDGFYKLVIAYVIFFVINTLLGGLFYVFGASMSASLLLVLYLSVGAFLVLKNKIALRNLTFSRYSLFKVVLTIGLVGLITLPVILDGLSVFRVVASGGDNISHIELFKANITTQGYFYAPPAETEVFMTKNLAGYPQGLHLNMYLLADTLDPITGLTKSPKLLVSFYYVYSIALFFIFAWMFFILTKNRDNHSPVAISATLILFSGILFSLFALGFQTQIASYVLFLLMLWFLEQAYLKSSTLGQRQVSSALAVIMAVSISFTWMFLVPVAVLICFICTIDSYKLIKVPAVKKHLKFVLTLAVLGLMVIVQPLVQYIFSNKELKGVNEIGFTSIIPLYVLFILIIFSSLYFFLPKIKSSRVMLVGLLVSSIFSVSVLIFQMLRVGEPRYYFHKSAFAVLLICAVIITRFVTSCISQVKWKSVNPYTKRVVALCFISAGLIVTLHNTTNKNDYFFLYKTGGFSHELNETAIRAVIENPSDSTSMIALGSCNRAHDYTVTRMVGVLAQKNDYPRQALLANILDPDQKDLIDAVKTYQIVSNTDLTIYSTDHPTSEMLKLELEGGKKEVFVDLDFGHIEKNQYTCPNAVR